MDPYGINDLQSIFGAGNPEAYMQAQKQVGLADQFQQEKLAQERETLRGTQLSNMFNEQNNPLKVQRTMLDNQGVGFDNDVKGVAARKATTNEALAITAEQKKLIQEADASDLQMIHQQAERMYQSSDPAISQQGADLMKKTKSFLELKQKHSDEMEKVGVQRKSAEEVAKIGAGATVQAAQIGANSRIDVAKLKGGKGGSLVDAAMSGKVGFEKAAAALYLQAEIEQDPEQKALLTQQAKTMEQANLRQKQAQLQGRPDLGALGITPQTVEGAIGGNNTAPKSAGKSITSLPQGAKQIGTSNGKPVYQTPDGRKFIGE